MTAAVNTHCPWSGEPVRDDALTVFNGHTVGFCRPECRDKFDKAVSVFEAAAADRKKQGALPTPLPGEIYAPRRFRFVSVERFGLASFKTYVIDEERRPLDPDAVLQALRLYTQRCPVLPSLPEPVFGHVMIHRGTEGDWLLAQWWKGGGILRGVIARDPAGKLAFEPEDKSLLACVWEMVIMTHERNAWIKHVLCGEPDLDAYLDYTLPNGQY
ncbi:MAG: hypothetical protein V2I43_04850 [Parvularcula sp.]|jgi:hypothetical protein|nr:hypothetical protein [Parvularcula sp.]